MLKRVIQFFFLLVGAGLGYKYGPSILEFLGNAIHVGAIPIPEYIGAFLGAAVLFVVSLWPSEYLVGIIRRSEEHLIKLPVTDVLFGAIGMIIGLIVAFLLFLPISNIDVPVLSNLLPLFLSVLCAYFGFQVGLRKRDEIMAFFSANRLHREKKKEEKHAGAGTEFKILDTSVIIDGRIADICKTGFIEGAIVIPEFVLEELQHIADSSDVLKRNRGRRGLDILNKIQKELKVKVIITDKDFEDISEVDSKLVKLAKVMKGKVVTNDFNLNKVCELQGVSVLNINDLANAVKPVVLPGEELHIQVIKDGKENGQGVAYLDDGTMVVVEGGREFIGNLLEVIVTSVLQTSAGRMIFAKPKIIEKQKAL